MRKALFITFLVLFLDQSFKLWVKTNMVLGQEIEITSWFKILFVENKGMAFGWELHQGDLGKIILTVIRVITVGIISYWLYKSIKKNISTAFIISISFILAGAIGNLIDSVLYGVIFNDSYGQIAEIFPIEGGYSKILHGRVVDMLYFPLWQGYLPNWIPFYGGEYFSFFEYVFNIADSAITIGIVIIMLFNVKVFPMNKNNEEYYEDDNELPPLYNI